MSAGALARAPETAQAAKPGSNGKKPLTFEVLYSLDKAKKVDFSGKQAPGATWIDAGHWIQLETSPDAKESPWSVVDAVTGATKPYLDGKKFAAAVKQIPGVDEDEIEGIAKRSLTDTSSMDARREAVLVDVADDLWIVRFDAAAPVRLTATPDVEEEEATFSPDGTRVAFVAKNDLYVADAKLGNAKRLTTDGSDMVLNGKLDWLYQEEVFGRGTFRAFWWSPDSARLAYLRLDQSGVPNYTLVDDATYEVKVETSPYPRSGEGNPTVALRVADVASAASANVDLSAYAAEEPIVVEVAWSPDNRLVYQVQDREQRWLDLRICAPDGTSDTRLLRETTPAWVDRTDSPRWLADGTWLWTSERSGWRHLYRYKDSECLGPVTEGEWEVRDVHGVDEKNGLVYFSGTQRSPIGSDAYSVRLDGKALERLTQRAGTHAVSFNPDFALFLDKWSDITTPTQRRLHRASDGSEVRLVDANPVPALAEYQFTPPELLQVETRDGFKMEAMRILPPDYDPAHRYPVMVFGYWGPHAQTVKNAWGGSGGMFQQLLAQRGVVVWSCDGRTSSGKGGVATWPCYQRLGESELADLEDGVKWLVDQGIADPDRIGITGWSYGGFMTSYALTHSKTFALGLAGGSVTDWRNYDTIYTERFMRTPANNKDGYARTSVVAAADKLHGHLVLAHGAIDDNVHPGNTMQLAYALQKAGKSFELALYPKQRHGVTNPAQSNHWKSVQLAAIERWLLRPTP